MTCVCKQQGKLTQAILCLLYARKEIDKRRGAEWEKGESLTHLLFSDRQLPYVHTCAVWELWLKFSHQQRAAEGFTDDMSLSVWSELVLWVQLTENPVCLDYIIEDVQPLTNVHPTVA